MQKEHNVIKFFMPLIAVIYGILISLLCACVIEDNFKLYQYLISDILAVIAIILTLILLTMVIPKIFPQMKIYKFKLPNAYILLGIFLIVPLWAVIKYRIVYRIALTMGTADLESLTYTSQELKQDLVAGISAVLFAPVYEELSFRYMALAPFKRRSSQILFCVTMALFFAILHGRNMMAAFMDAIIYGVLFIITKNVIINIWMHMCTNLFAAFLAIMSYCKVFDMKYNPTPTAILINSPPTTLFFGVMAVMGVSVFIIGHKRSNGNILTE